MKNLARGDGGARTDLRHSEPALNAGKDRARDEYALELPLVAARYPIAAVVAEEHLVPRGLELECQLPEALVSPAAAGPDDGTNAACGALFAVGKGGEVSVLSAGIV